MELHWILLVLACIGTARVQGRAIALNDAIDVTEGTGELWKPSDGTSREDFLKYNGLTPEEMARVKQKMLWLKMSQMMDVSFDITNANHSAMIDEPRLDECIMLTEEQIDEMLLEQREAQKNKPTVVGEPAPGHQADLDGNHRQKRKIQNFEKYIRRKWTAMPIRYKFDGEHSEAEKSIIRGAFEHWMDQTCVLFEELPTNADYNDNHILITRRSTGCHSYVGRVSIIPQQLNLQSSCLWEFGIAVHEIGHALGLWHEQQRPDRDDHIRINWENLGSYVGQFYKNTASVDLGVPYDLGSVMHYSPKAGSKNNQYTMESLDPQYQHNMGQRTGLSFLDAKIINLAYCSAKCANKPLRRPCEREGYQDPKDCSKCICPDGFSGKYCEDLEPAFNAQCGGELMATTSPQTIKTPGYDSPKYYDNFEQCNWHIKAPANHDIIFKFDDEEFGIYCHSHDRCYHWAEVRYRNSLGQQGPRFCCYRAPNDVIRGELGEMMIIFKTNYSVPWTTSRRGFKASFYAEPRDDKPPTTTTTEKPTTKTTTPTTTTTTPTTTTTTPPTTTPRNDECDAIDLAFLLDSSGSIMRDNWQSMLNFVAKMVSQFSVGKDKVRVGVASYGNAGTLHFDLDKFFSLESMILSIYTIPWKDQWTNTADGLFVARTEIFSTSGDRSSAQNKLIVITDGESNKNDDQTISEAKATREQGIEIYVIGIGDEFNYREANDITEDKDRIFKVETFEELTGDYSVTRIKAGMCGTTTTTGTIVFEWACSFENHRDTSPCGITQDQDDDFDWTVRSGKTPSRSTGPSAALDGRYYAFIEASNPRKRDDYAVMTLPDLKRTGTHCINFDYHMYGFHINTLLLLKKTSDGQETQLWQRSKEQGDMWIGTTVEVELEAGDQLAFKAVRGGEYSGDIALDNIRLHDGSCSISAGDYIEPVRDRNPSSGATGVTTWLGATILATLLTFKHIML